MRITGYLCHSAIDRFDLCDACRPGNKWASQPSLSINVKRKETTKDDQLAVSRSINIKKATAKTLDDPCN
ncbi:MAG TPA: hypothetical protein VJ941_05960 [Gracilimonas sp.]|nr:hypothetical protein [Gracilimonas sp.]